MNQQLTANQIRQLFDLVKGKGVKYIDVQHEIVDHLATKIECNQKNNPTINIQNQIDRLRGSFTPEMGQLVRSKEKSMNRYWQKKTFGFIMSYFKLPRVLWTLLLFTALLIGFYNIGKPFVITTIIALLITIIYTLIHTYKNVNYSRENEKKYLVLRMYLGQTLSMTFLPLSLLNILHFFNESDSNILQQAWTFPIVASIATFTFIWCHACVTTFPKMLFEEIALKYPYLKLTN